MNANLQEEWNGIEFKAGRKEEAHYDLAVVDFGSRQSLSELLSERPAARAALADELKKLKKDEDSQQPKIIRIAYEGKGGLTALVLSGDPGAYFLQEAFRKAFCAEMSVEQESREINLSLLGLKDSHAETFLNWAASLAVITRFRAEVYGKRAGELKKLAPLKINYTTSLNRKMAEEQIRTGRILGVCNNQVKYLAELPSNILNPRTYKDRVQTLVKQMAKSAGGSNAIEFDFIDKKQLQKRGAGCYLAVIQGDLNDSAGIVHLRYKGKKAKQKIALVGKGLCFDTGGYNIKVGEYMYNMHRDMTGSAVALSLFRALVELEAPYEIHCYLALAENLISHEAYRPNDVVVASNGLSVEVVDTDAEGRMVLSDTLAIASEQKPDLMIDFATLTGAVVRAIDTRRCGAFSNQDRLARTALEAGDRCGERVWTFPIGGDYNEQLKSEIADLRQAATGNSADHIYASTFLSKFVGKGIPWIHIDLAADTNKGGLGLVPTDTTGFGVRFGVELIDSFFK